ncbi:NAD(P)H-binding protein [Streptomyces sp. CAU 1734]|uniref:NAD(P)H-binding protein n=1 Tax=Streptomyces sp. CAU 1734 TaxID=3140360 RepID=UPI0032611292
MTANTKRETVLVTSATGKTGRRVAKLLAEQGTRVRAGSRKAAAPDTAGAGSAGVVETVLDWEDPSTWGPALNGVDAAFVAFYPDLAVPGAADAMREFGRAARENGVRRLVLLCGRGEPQAEAAEDALRECGVDLTLVRAAFFTQNFDEGLLAEGVRHGAIPMPAGQTTEPFIDADDIAEVAVAALTRDGYAGRTLELTGPRLLTFGEVATELTRASGREVRYVNLSEAEFREMLPTVGLSEEEAGWLAGVFTMLLDGHNSFTTDTVREVLGREPKDFTEYAREAAATGVWAV